MYVYLFILYYLYYSAYRASDRIPRYSELMNLQRKWNDGAILQVAVVDHGDISFYSFNNVNIQELIPFDSLHE